MSTALNFRAGASTAACRVSAADGASVIERKADTFGTDIFLYFILAHAVQNCKCFTAELFVCLRYIPLNTLLIAHCSSCTVLAKMPFCGPLKVCIRNKDKPKPVWLSG